MKRPKNPRSRKYKKVISRGCGFVKDYWGECDCVHAYDWCCDECPINLEIWKREEKEYNKLHECKYAALGCNHVEGCNRTISKCGYCKYFEFLNENF